MESTHNYKSQATSQRIRSQLKQYVTRFVNQNADVFEALSRAGAPFGGNSLPTRQYTTTTALSTQEQMLCIQEKLDVLTEQLSQLSKKLAQDQPAQSVHAAGKAHGRPGGSTKPIGIERFWALHGKSRSLA